jgi:2-polyprenyl-3-methyl-5-hydroxy-6-metoxy-1,4-benzoquinol methylase
MQDNPSQLTFAEWLTELRTSFNSTQPELLSLFETYAAEAIFGRSYIASELASLPPGAKILEIGAGALILSCQLRREGFQVTALEPIGIGFSHFKQMRQIVIDRATALGCLPQNLNISAEALTEENTFDFAFSINVMEHVSNISQVITNVSKSLKVGAVYRFTAPNYLFPYEPHFNIPTLFSKQLTECVLRQKIFGNKKLSSPSATWKSLNWINVFQIKKIGRQLHGIQITFNRSFFIASIERLSSDTSFASRRSPVVKKILLFLVKYRLHQLLRFVPAGFQPTIDCRLQKTTELQVN